MDISGFTIVRNATLLDFPLEASVRSLLPVVAELVINVGASEDDTLERVRAIGDSRIRVLESTWDRTRGPAMLADETARAMAACRAAWGIYIQADEVFAEGGAERVQSAIARWNDDARVEGILVDYRHFYGGFDTVASNRTWYRREVRAIRLDPALGIHPYRDAQGFRAGPGDRRIRAVASGAVMHHYGWARPIEALLTKRVEDAIMDPARRALDPARPLLPWIPGLKPFKDPHPAVAQRWIAERRDSGRLVEPYRFHFAQLRHAVSGVVEALTGWRPFEFRNCDELRGHPRIRPTNIPRR